MATVPHWGFSQWVKYKHGSKVPEEHRDTDDGTVQFQIITKSQLLLRVFCGQQGGRMKGQELIVNIFTARRKVNIQLLLLSFQNKQIGLRKTARWGRREEITHLPPIKKGATVLTVAHCFRRKFFTSLSLSSWQWNWDLFLPSFKIPYSNDSPESEAILREWGSV